MSILWLTVPPWLLAVIVSLFGYWGERRLLQAQSSGPSRGTTEPLQWSTIVTLLITCYIFLSILPAGILWLFGPMLPFAGAQAGLALAIVVVIFGLIPTRLLDARRTGWDHAFWALLIDFLRVGGALTLVGWLLDL